jgi:prepilin-type N-terminal cleavage/methylation domain-containing protein
MTTCRLHHRRKQTWESVVLRRTTPPPAEQSPDSGRRSAGGRCSSRGFTLFEILIVLSILVMLISLTWPSLLRYVRERGLREQAHAVRVELNNARMKAVDGGITYQFRFEPGGRRYIVLPDQPPAAEPSASGAQSSIVASPAQAITVTLPVLSATLAEPCTFDVPKVYDAVTRADQPVVTERLPEEWLTALPDGTALRETGWSPPIRFYSDGAAEDGMVTVIDDQRRRIEVTVRGLTGSVAASPLVQERRP